MENREELVYEIDVLERLRDQSLKRIDGLHREYDLIRGTILGVIFGILGNVLVQFTYPVVDSLASASGLSIYTVGLAVSIIAFLAIIVVILFYRRNQKGLSLSVKETQEDTKKLEATILKRKEQLRQMDKLEKLRKSAEESGFMMSLGQ